MLKNTIIIALIILLIYYYYQQNNQPNLVLDKIGYDNLIKDLKRQVQHYQTLYQKRVAHDLDKKDVGVGTEILMGDKEIQTDNFIENKETQTSPILKHSRDTQTSLTNDNIDKLISQWNQVAQWATELGIDVNKKWNLEMMKNKLEKEVEELKEKEQDLSESQKKVVELTRDNQLKSQEVQSLITENKQLQQDKKKTAKTIHGLTILANNRKELLEQEKSALISLAKQKIAGKKEAKELLGQLEAKWQKEIKQKQEKNITLLDKLDKYLQEIK